LIVLKTGGPALRYVQRQRIYESEGLLKKKGRENKIKDGRSKDFMWNVVIRTVKTYSVSK